MSYLGDYDRSCARADRERAARKVAEYDEKQRNHEAWLAFCGHLSPVGRLR